MSGRRTSSSRSAAAASVTPTSTSSSTSSSRRGFRSSRAMRSSGPWTRMGEKAGRFDVGQRVGAAWLRSACGVCRFCKSGRENLCEAALFNGYHADGGYAEYMAVDEKFAYAIPDGFGDAEAAPLLCAGIVGYRALAPERGPGRRHPRALRLRRLGPHRHPDRPAPGRHGSSFSRAARSTSSTPATSERSGRERPQTSRRRS